ncbi:MAG: thioesterase family protein [Planctomycetota bacterium]
MPSEFRTTRRVEFADTDMAGIAHFANFFRWMEEVEHEFFRSLGHSVHAAAHGGAFGFVRAHASCDYARPARYEDVLDVRLRVEKKTAKALHYRFEFGAPAPAGQAKAPEAAPPLAVGRLEVVCVTRDAPDGPLRSTEIPASIADQLQAAP